VRFFEQKPANDGEKQMGVGRFETNL